MRHFAFFTAFFLAASAARITTDVGNPIDDLIKAALEYIRVELRNNEPLLLPSIPVINVTDDVNKIYLQTNLTDLYASNADTFEVTYMNNNLLQMWADFGVLLPTLKLDGKFEVLSGSTAFGKAVTGSGTFSLFVSNLNTTGHVQLELDDGSIQMRSLDLTYTVEGVQFTEEGLSVEGMTEEELEAIFNTALLKFCQDNEKEICENVSNEVVSEANAMMKGKSLSEIIEWLKNFVDGGSTTPSP